MQAELGLPLATDGEFRRSFWHYDFLDLLDGVAIEHRPATGGLQFAGTTLRPFHPAITGPIDFPADHPMLDHFRALAAVCSTTPKISIPGPSTVHFRTAADAIAPERYRDLDVLFDDIAAAYAKAVTAFYDAGCRYLQIDDIFFAYLCDPDQRAGKEAEGFDPDELIVRYASMLDAAIADRPDDLTIAMHMCRGNFRSTHAAAGGYDPAVDAIFNSTSVDVYYMEYDSDRAGGLELVAEREGGPLESASLAVMARGRGLEIEMVDARSHGPFRLDAGAKEELGLLLVPAEDGADSGQRDTDWYSFQEFFPTTIEVTIATQVPVDVFVLVGGDALSTS